MPMLGHLVDSSPDHPSSSNVEDLLARMDDADFASCALPLLNAVRRHPLKAFVDVIPSAVRHRVEGVPGERGADIRDNLRLFELERQLDDRAALDLVSLVDEWREARSWENFAFVLLLAGYGDGGNPVLERDAERLLREHLGEGRSSAPVLLATRMADRAMRGVRRQKGTPARSKEWTTAVSYLEGVIDEWEGQLPIEVTIAALQALATYAQSGREDYTERLVRWHAYLQEREGLTRLPTLIAQGRHFLVVWHYFTTLNFWGLNTYPDDSPYNIESMDAEEIAARTQEVASGRHVADPLITINGQVRLAADFVRDGHAAFRAEAALGAEEARETMNRVAAARLPALLSVMTSLDSIPVPIREMLLRHEKSLLHHAMPR
jgi:hypothetical protein